MDEKTRKNQMRLISDASEVMGSQAALARKLGHLPQNFNRYATGQREISMSLYLAIKKVLESGK